MISRKAAEEKFSRGGAGTRRIKQAGVVYEPYDYWRASAPIPILRNYGALPPRLRVNKTLHFGASA
jgi:hypothetical protein